jgi:transcriptional regulator with XRE-family HTH domain
MTRKTSAAKDSRGRVALKLWRLKSGMSQHEAAGLFAMQDSAYNSIERGARVPGKNTAPRFLLAGPLIDPSWWKERPTMAMISELHRSEAA